MLAVGRGHSFSGRHVGGFADAAHLTRTFNTMFGIPPSVMMRGDFYEVASPLETAA